MNVVTAFQTHVATKYYEFVSKTSQASLKWNDIKVVQRQEVSMVHLNVSQEHCSSD